MERLAQLEVIVETLDEAISLLDAELRLVAANRRFYELLGLPSDRFAPGTPLEDVFRYNAERGEYGPGDTETLVAERMGLARRFEPHCFERTRSDGRTIEIRGRPLPGGGFVTSYTDITERKQAEEALRERSRAARLLKEVAVAANEVSNVREALRLCLDEVCAYAGWPVGHAYLRDHDGTGKLVPSGVWHFDDSDRFEALCRAFEANRLAPEAGLPGQVLVSAEPAWISDIAQDGTLGETPGIKAVHAFPVMVGSSVHAVLEFFSEEAAEPDGHVLETMAQVGSQLGRALERQQATATLIASETRLAGILDIAPEAIISVDGDAHIRMFNQGAEAIFGYLAGEVIGQHLDVLLPARYRGYHRKHVEDFSRSTRFTRLMNERADIVGLRKDGSEFPAEASISKLELGQETILTVILHDVTRHLQAEEALQQSESKFRNLIEGSIQGIYVHKNWKFLFANQAMADIFKYDSPEDLISLGSVEMLVGPHERARLKEFSDARMRGEAVPRRHTAQFLCRDGSLVWVETVSQLVTWDNEPAIQSTVIDITERKQAENALRERVDELEEARRELERQGEELFRLAEDLKVARDEAQAANRAKSEFLAAMSHELRTPLNAILGFSEIMMDEALGLVSIGRYREYAGDIHFSGQHLLDLINDILDLSKIESGAEQLNEEDIEVSKVVRSVVRVVRCHAEQNGLTLFLDMPEDLPLLRGDERKLKQILVNLLSNAIKFTEPGGKIEFAAECRAGSGFVFRLSDTGIGIAPDDIPRALSQFGQIDGVLNRKYEGTGLGLPLAKSLVELHGGSVELQSEVGIGTTVTVRLPAERIVWPWGEDVPSIGGQRKTG